MRRTFIPRFLGCHRATVIVQGGDRWGRQLRPRIAANGTNFFFMSRPAPEFEWWTRNPFGGANCSTRMAAECS
jgi:hypothetical protein